MTVYSVVGLRSAAGVKVAVRVPASYVVLPATALPPGPLSAIVTVPASTFSLNVADTALPSGTSVAFGAGERSVTVGFVVSSAVVSNTTSTQ